MRPLLSVLLFPILLSSIFPFQAVRASGDSSKASPVPQSIRKTSHSSPWGIAGGHKEPSVLSRLPLDFIQNLGQRDRTAKYVARKGMTVVSFENDSIRFDPAVGRNLPLALTFEGASGNVGIAGEGMRDRYYNFFFGNDPKRWRSRASAYSSLLYRGLYDGIDMRVREEAGKLEYDLILAPSANLNKVVVRADGASRIEITADGSLVLQTASGEFRQTPLVTWEETPEGERYAVECRFRKIDTRRYGFDAPHRDPGLKLVIDPGLEWGTFLGGGGHDTIDSIALAKDGSGDVIIAGFTRSADFPATNGRLGPIGQSPFVARINSTGSALVYATLFGGSGVDSALGLEVSC